jgi:hypothetical protein
MWYQLAAEDAVVGGYASGGRHEHSGIESYLTLLRKKQQNELLSTRGCCVGDMRD